MKKELLIYMVIFIILALALHPDLLTSPVERFYELPNSGAYGIGAFHPLVFALLGYLVLAVSRGIWKGFSKIFFKKED